MTHAGIQAFDVADEWRPEVILLDIGLPKLNVYEVAARYANSLGDTPPS